MNKQDALKRIEIIEREATMLRKIVEAPEKPKLRHGDFGYCDEPLYPRIVLGEDKLASGSRVFDRHKNDEPTVILGNVFDLMKGWDKPFEEYCKDNPAIGIQIKSNTIKLYMCIGSNGCNKENDCCIYHIETAEEIWHELGHAIADLKQKKEIRK